jgi:GTP pyrophosphokinase/guanosine-3',5'-bis(diphosphate) 3'-pyrophosphohydrolase
VKINGELKPMRTALQNGDVVEIIRGTKRDTPADWRSLTVTGRARSAIRRHIRGAEREEFLRLGRATLDQTITKAGKSIDDVSLKPVLEVLAVASEADLFEAIGRGRISPVKVAELLFPTLMGKIKPAQQRKPIQDARARLFVRGGGLTPGVSVHFGQCCTPLPGDRIVGILEANKGLTVHTIDCQQLAEYADDDSVWQDLQWTPQAEQSAVGLARLRATVRNGVGVLGQVTTLIGEAGGNIRNLNLSRRHQDFFDLTFDVEVEDAKHATLIMAALRTNPSVDTVERVKG